MKSTSCRPTSRGDDAARPDHSTSRAGKRGRQVPRTNHVTLLWMTAIAASVLVFGSGALGFAIYFGGNKPHSTLMAEADGAATRVETAIATPEAEPGVEVSGSPGVAKRARSRPVTLARSGPSAGERVGWSRAGTDASRPNSATIIVKRTRSRPDAIARATPLAGERVGWAKGGPEALIQRLTEQELVEQLALAKTIGLGPSAQGVLKSWTSSIKATGNAQVIDASPLLSVRPDLTMLPLRSGASCQLPARAAANFAVLTRKLHIYIDGLAPKKLDGTRVPINDLERVLREEKRGKRPEWLRVEAVPALLQILMHEEKPLRRLLVDLLSEIKEPRATAALVRRAIFDLDPEIRLAAQQALKGRNPEDYRAVFLKALRYPWAPAAEHAAEALVALRDRAAVPTLVTLLDQPDPAGVQPLKSRFIVQDLVKIQHTRNCLMCHAPSATGTDICMKVDPWVKRRTVMTTKKAAALVASGQIPASAIGGYGAGGGGGGGGRGGAGGGGGGGGCVSVSSDLQIRFDVNFLREDFSIQLPIGGAGDNQRFDYVVRTRVFSRQEADRLRRRITPRDSYPQRDAVLFALRRLTGKNAGTTAVAWKKLYPDAEIEVESGRLVQKMLKSNGLELPVLLKFYGESKGEAYTRALEIGVARLTGSAREDARNALSRRFSEMEAVALRKRLTDSQPGVRHAAILACERKKEKALVGDLIARLDDSDADTARLARSALKVITGKDLENAEAWRQWFKDGVALGD